MDLEFRDALRTCISKLGMCCVHVFQIWESGAYADFGSGECVNTCISKCADTQVSKPRYAEFRLNAQHNLFVSTVCSKACPVRRGHVSLRGFQTPYADFGLLQHTPYVDFKMP